MSERTNPMRKKLFLGLGLLLALVLVGVVGVRTYSVNKDAPVHITERYLMNEWVDLNGAFLDGQDENTQGYFLRVIGARRMSYNEYIQSYGNDKSHEVEGLDEKSVIALDIEIKNDEAPDNNGHMPLMFMYLVPELKNEAFLWNERLWVENEPKADGLMFISVTPQTTYTAHLPFTKNTDTSNNSAYYGSIDASSFELTVANAPVRKVIDIAITD